MIQRLYFNVAGLLGIKLDRQKKIILQNTNEDLVFKRDQHEEICLVSYRFFCRT